MSIDFSQTVTAEEKAAAALAEAGARIKAQVATQISSVISPNAQLSILAALAAGALSQSEQATFAAGQAWIEETKTEGRAAATEGRAPVWPEVPAGVAALADLF